MNKMDRVWRGALLTFVTQMFILGAAYVFQPPKALALSVYAAVTVGLLARDVGPILHNWVLHVQIFNEVDVAAA